MTRDDLRRLAELKVAEAGRLKEAWGDPPRFHAITLTDRPLKPPASSDHGATEFWMALCELHSANEAAKARRTFGTLDLTRELDKVTALLKKL